MKRILIAMVFGLGLMAQPYGGRPSSGIDSFSIRIDRGERSGLLTHREAARLRHMDRDLRRETERAYRSGFGLSPRERARIDSMRIALDREITRQMRDDERNYRNGFRR